MDVDEDRHQVVLDDRIDGRREAGGDGDHLVAGLEPVGPRFGEVRADRATRLADEPELTSKA